MRKIFGWILIVVFALVTLLPIYPFIVEKTVISYNQLGLPILETVKEVQYSWFVIGNVLELLEGNVTISIGRFFAYFMILGIGIWLIKHKRISSPREGDSQ